MSDKQPIGLLGVVIGEADNWDWFDNGFQATNFYANEQFKPKFNLKDSEWDQDGCCTAIAFDIIAGTWQAYMGPEGVDLGSSGNILDLFKK